MNLFESLFREAAFGTARLTPTGGIASSNPALERILGRPVCELAALDLFQLTHPEDRRETAGRFAELLAGRLSTFEAEIRFLRGDGSPIWVQLTATRPRGAEADPIEVIAVVQDISARRIREQQLLDEREQVEDLWRSASSAIAIIDSKGDVAQVYPGFTALFGYAREEAIGRRLYDLIVPKEGLEEFLRNHAEALAGRAIQGELLSRHKDGRLLHVSVLGRGYRLGPDRDGVFLIYRDNTERKESEALLRRLSTTDELTGLWNRRAFYALASEEVRRAERQGCGIVVLYADLVDFKRINDTYGHAEGDAVLRDVAHLLLDSSRGSDTVARIGGDEFVVLATGSPEGEPIMTARIRRGLEALNARGGRSYEIGLSMGTTYYEPGSGLDIQSAVALADRAMYREKERVAGTRRRRRAARV